MTFESLDRYHLAKKRLPFDHPFIDECRKAVEDDYRVSGEQERRFRYTYQYAYRVLSYEAMKELYSDLCRMMGVKPIRGVRSKENEFQHYGAYYYSRTKIIHIDRRSDLSMLLHELSHHIHHERHFWRCVFVDESHGKEFCRIEQELFDLLLAHQHDKERPLAFFKNAKEKTNG
jgi:hypothetical protein